MTSKIKSFFLIFSLNIINIIINSNLINLCIVHDILIFYVFPLILDIFL